MSETRYAVRYIPGTESHARWPQVGDNFTSREAAEDFRAGCSNPHLLEVTTQPETLPKVATLPKPEVQDLPDLHAEVPCNAVSDPDPRRFNPVHETPTPARWRDVLRPCGCMRLLCEAHHVRLMDAMRYDPGVECSICRAVVLGIDSSLL